MKWKVSEFGWNGIAGVYCVCVFNTTKQKNQIIYIGSSKDIGKRVNSTNHFYRLMCNDKREDEIVFIKYKETSNYIQIEKQLIKKIKPFLNIKHNG
jgi:excinuclease UvrABC nuclease subunit